MNHNNILQLTNLIISTYLAILKNDINNNNKK